MTTPDRPMTSDALVGDLRAVWSSLDALLASLEDDDWDAPTDCPGWSVQDVVVHVIGTERQLQGEAPPDVEVPEGGHLRNDIGRMNEAWILDRRGDEPAEVLVELRTVVAERDEALSAMAPEEFEADSWTPAGPGTYGRFMQIRVFDTWIHEQDIREAVGRRGHLEGPAVQRTLTEVRNALPFVVGKRAGAPDGSSVRFEVTGPEAWTVDVVVEGRARVTDDLEGEPTTTITTDLPTFIRLAAGRRSGDAVRADGLVSVSGDQDLGRRVVDAMGYTI